MVSAGERHNGGTLQNVPSNQNKPIGRAIAPTIMGGRRSSGMGLPCFSRAFLTLVEVE
jgi:hypothetical protein